jgi:methyl-accepting chemotaxis protein
MNAYHKDFKVRADVELKLVDEVKKLSELFAVSSPKLDDVAGLIKDNYEALSKQREDLSDFTFQFILSIIVGISILILVLSMIIGNKIASPVIALTNVLKSLSENDLSVDVPGVNRKDEIGSMAKAVEVLKRNTIRMQELDAEQKVEQDRQIERGKKLEELIVGFEKQVEEMIGTLSSAATELNSTAQSMSEISEDACGKSEAMTLASESTMQNIQVVASAAEELSASISELSMQVQGTSQATSSATSDVNQASQQITGLLKASERIGSVVELILDIAEQTNLLALNATIEAARAGDAGKGFAVVASEVKSLATETSKATEQISQEVQSVQSEVDSAVKAIKSIEVKINEVNQSASAIAAAIEEQNATTEEISRNTQSSASNMAGVNENVTHVMQAARNTGDSASEVLTASKGVSEQSSNLKDRIAGFLMEVKAI